MINNTILYSSAGMTEILLALPENDLLGGAQWAIPENPAFQVTPVAKLANPNPTPTFKTIGLYNVTLKTEAGVLRFQEVQGGVHPVLPLVQGAISMITHPVSTTLAVHANLPVGGVQEQPLLIGVKDNGASTGYHWEITPAQEPGLLTKQEFFPPDTKLIGAPGFRIFEFKAEERGTYTVQLKLLPPAGKQPVTTFVVTLTAINV